MDIQTMFNGIHISIIEVCEIKEAMDGSCSNTIITLMDQYTDISFIAL